MCNSNIVLFFFVTFCLFLIMRLRLRKGNTKSHCVPKEENSRPPLTGKKCSLLLLYGWETMQKWQPRCARSLTMTERKPVGHVFFHEWRCPALL